MDDWNSGQPINQCIPFHVTDTLWMNLKQFLWWFKNRYANFFTLSQRVPTTRILLMVTIFNCAFLTIYCFNFTVRTYIESKICIPYQPWILCINGTIFQKIHFCQHAKTIKVGRKWDFLMLEPQFPSFFLDQESIVRVPLTRVATEEKPLISENFILYRLFKNLFLPQGYPDSVSDDYIQYQFWDTVQAFCSTINGKRCYYHYIIQSFWFKWL